MTGSARSLSVNVHVSDTTAVVGRSSKADRDAAWINVGEYPIAVTFLGSLADLERVAAEIAAAVEQIKRERRDSAYVSLFDDESRLAGDPGFPSPSLASRGSEGES